MTTDSKPSPLGPASPAGPTGPALQLTAGWVADAMGGRVVAGDPAYEFTGVSIDTRTVASGELFIAIRGDRFDGADFVAAAVAAGAAGAVVATSGGPDLGSGRGGALFVVIEVADTTAALQALARRVRKASGTKVVAITGSAGKTTTKEVTAEFLAARYTVVRNRGNLNNHIGLPLSLIALRHRPEYAVVELGMSHAGEISTLVKVAEPDVRVWTNVGDAHIGFFDSPDAIADAKAEIFEGATRSTLLVANADDNRIVARLPAFAGRTVTFGINRPADVRATAVVDRGIEGTNARIVTSRGTVDLQTPLVGRGNLSNVLAAAAVANECDVPLPVIVEQAARLRPASHRGEIVKLANGAIVLDDSYNANPTATMQALDVLAASKLASRRLAVLGEMLELGHRSVELHQDVGRAAARTGVDVLVTVGGPPAAALADAAVAAGLAQDRVRHLATSDEAAELVAMLVSAGDLVLVKGSRGVGTDRVVARLKAGRD
jgi:UDP-N-acetylmuramoyl-tripeptide--D-alanyl-D-alanine ligase